MSETARDVFALLYTVVAFTIVIMFALAACGTEPAQSNQSGIIEEKVLLNDGRVITCLYIDRTVADGRGGLSCDWPQEQPK